MKNSLEELFGSKERWRLIKMFLLNENEKWDNREIAAKTKINANRIRSLVANLKKIGFLKEVSLKGRKYYRLDDKFPFSEELKRLVVKSNVFPQCESLGKIRDLGDIRLGIVAGVFLDNPKARTDLLIVGDNISADKMKGLLTDLESEMGREVNYSLMNYAEFKYRINLFDRFILEIFESPHEIVINKVVREIQQLKEAKKLL